MALCKVGCMMIAFVYMLRHGGDEKYTTQLGRVGNTAVEQARQLTGEAAQSPA